MVSRVRILRFKNTLIITLIIINYSWILFLNCIFCDMCVCGGWGGGGGGEDGLTPLKKKKKKESR